MRKIIIALMFVLAVQSTFAGVLSASNKHRIVITSLEKFWGNARRSDGSVILPKTEIERSKVPIAINDAYLVVDVGEISSFAERCELDWRSNLHMLTRSARKSGLSETQVAYVAFLHGLTMGLLEKSLSTIECDSEMHERIGSRVKSLASKAISLAPNATDAL